MKYLTGIHALNIPCNLETCGDWHQSALKWEKMVFRESNDSIWGDYGIEYNKSIPCHEEKYNVANHIRACLDLLDLGDYTNPQGMNDDFICNPKYDNEIFTHVIMLKAHSNWDLINAFMGWEYKSKWFRFLRDAKLRP